MVKVGIIGGSGFDNPDILKEAKEMKVITPYGEPSSELKIGIISGVEVVLLARHGRQHTIPPTQVNHRANIYALKSIGCDYILSTTAVGSLRDEIKRGDLVILDQFIDFTRRRAVSMFDEFKPHEPKHTPMAEPFSSKLREALIESARELGLEHHAGGTVITIEGARFSTRAESWMFRSWGADVINMSIAPEAICANEIGIPYAAVAMSTDYDCWKEDEEPVRWEQIAKIMGDNAGKVVALFLRAIPKIADRIKSKIRTIPNWPKQGIMFRDVTTLLKDREGFSEVIERLYARYKDRKIDVIAGIEARGFIIGSVLAHKLGVGFVPLRKKGKLPAEVVAEEYALEYGTDRIEIHKDAISPGDNVLVCDDLVATGGTALAACNLVKKLGGEVEECCFIVDLPDLGGKKRIESAGFRAFNLVEFEGG
jgi:5'-methylthioadenosine phosphorylase